MKNIWIRTCCSILCFVMILMIFVGCGDADIIETTSTRETTSTTIGTSTRVTTSTTGGTNTTASTETEDEFIYQDLEEETITIILPQGLTPEKPDMNIVLEEIERRIKDSINVKLNFRFLSDQIVFTKMSGPLADWDISVYSNMSSDNLYMPFFKDITDIFPLYAPELYKIVDKKALDYVTWDNKLYGIPMSYPMSDTTYAIVREDLVKKYKIPKIETIDDYEVYMSIIKQNEKDIVPGYISASSVNIFAPAYDYQPLAYNIDMPYLVYKRDNSEIKLMDWRIIPEMPQILDYYNRFLDNGYLFENWLPSWPRAFNQIILGKISSVLIHQTQLGPQPVECAVSEVSNLWKLTHPDWVLKAYRLYPEKKTAMIPPIFNQLHNERSGTKMLFNKNSPRIERALMFLNWIYSSQENYDLFMYGIEGRHYITEGDDKYQITNLDNWVTSPYIGWSYSDIFKVLKYERFYVGTPDNMRETYINHIVKDTYYPPAWGFESPRGMSDSNDDSYINGFRKVLKRTHSDGPSDIEFLRARINFRKRFEFYIQSGKYSDNGYETILNKYEELKMSEVLSDMQKLVDYWRTH